MRTVNAQFLFDFGSPNAYLAHKVIPDIEARTGVTFEYVPILLGGLFRPAIARRWRRLPASRTSRNMAVWKWNASSGGMA